ncbi:MAG: YmdB family metallophosphoesterase [Treponema sp.]|jgi:metallophosphoesterase (TIGR00282 family)|nr:YmdB family metallophosphoesterase [Treponema sp.]
MKSLRVIMIGDVVGDPGLDTLDSLLSGLIREYSADFTVVNGENAAEGFGMTEAALKRILEAGADVVTSGNHVWEKREFWQVMESESRILRPANYPEPAAGRGWLRIEKAGVSWLAINLQGREFMTPIDCPFRVFDSIINSEAANTGVSIILVDFHAESTREKEALGYYLDGRAGLVVGTHTHVQTADERILPRGSGYITDLGMTGVVNSIIGMDEKVCLDRARNQVLYRMECAKPGPGHVPAIQGVFAEMDRDTGKALTVRRISRELPG